MSMNARRRPTHKHAAEHHEKPTKHEVSAIRKIQGRLFQPTDPPQSAYMNATYQHGPPERNWKIVHHIPAGPQ